MNLVLLPDHVSRATTEFLWDTVKQLEVYVDVDDEHMRAKYKMVSRDSVKWPRMLNSKSVESSRKHANFRGMATDFAPMQVDDTHIP